MPSQILMWVDIPTTLTNAPQAIQQQIQAYHAIAKDEVNNLATRIAALEAINTAINALTQTEQTQELEQVKLQAQEKIKYLQGLVALYKKYPHGLQHALKNYEVFKLSDKTGYRLYSLGEHYAAEAIDPANRPCSPSIFSTKLCQWQVAVEQDATTPDFFLWLENYSTQEIWDNNDEMATVQVRYPQSLRDICQYRLMNTSAGIVISPLQDAKDFDTTGFANGYAIFTLVEPPVDQMGQDFDDPSLVRDHLMLLAGEDKLGKQHHSSFNGGNDVIAAGQIKVVPQGKKDATGRQGTGKISYLDNNSGHYKPDIIATKNAVEFLNAKDMLDDDCFIKCTVYYKDATGKPCSDILTGTSPQDFMDKADRFMDEYNITEEYVKQAQKYLSENEDFAERYSSASSNAEESDSEVASNESSLLLQKEHGIEAAIKEINQYLNKRAKETNTGVLAMFGYYSAKDYHQRRDSWLSILQLLQQPEVKSRMVIDQLLQEIHRFSTGFFRTEYADLLFKLGQALMQPVNTVKVNNNEQLGNLPTPYIDASIAVLTSQQLFRQRVNTYIEKASGFSSEETRKRQATSAALAMKNYDDVLVNNNVNRRKEFLDAKDLRASEYKNYCKIR